jgi:transposase
MSEPFWLTDEQMVRLRPFFPKSHGKLRVDDRRVLSAIVFVNRNGLRWRDAPKDYGPHKTLYNRRVNRRPKRTPYRRPKGTPFVERCDGYGGRAVRAGCGVGRA